MEDDPKPFPMAGIAPHRPGNDPRRGAGRPAAEGNAVEGAFAPPQLACLSLEDQIFVTAFLRSHGSIKEMEQTFGVSYPTIKARLNRIAGQLEFVDTNPSPRGLRCWNSSAAARSRPKRP